MGYTQDMSGVRVHYHAVTIIEHILVVLKKFNSNRIVNYIIKKSEVFFFSVGDEETL